MRVKLRTDAIREEIRRERIRLVEDAPEPAVINIDAVLLLGRDRELEWGAITLHAPPLSFTLGARLLVAANALKDLREKDAPSESVKAAQSLAAALLRKALRNGPAPKPGKRRIPRPYLGCWSCLFTRDDPEAVEGLVRFLIDVPDEAAYQPAEKRVTIDLMDNVASFAKAFPAWMKDGWPLSWAHFQYGMRHLGRLWAREELRMAAAMRAGQTDKKDFKTYVTQQKFSAGWA